MDCVKLPGCPFYNDRMPMDHGIGSIYKKKYCKGDHHLCARYKVICEAGERFVPANLYPNMLDIAETIIASVKKG
ncbi:hypothetical protein [Desulfosporosinus youngiae]|uniref:Uncharacterized protein n=1 Tax=Desulfosporosinus youngiae DSM 17734 TaxID=768710 RepID=H5Y134_9FIRM|nr:hypothetical protein [Desulfosporosinus youngiae]EHQ87254.1 hypothetical protein DesyoDRAFT_0020 [Desulfosporosinus youngiae DSM 17734]